MSRHAYPFGVFCIDQIPNQPQVAHCHSFAVYESHQGKGFAHILKRHQHDVLKSQGYDYATCTTAGDNVRQRSVLRQAGWKALSEFKNRRGGVTIVWGWEVEA